MIYGWPFKDPHKVTCAFGMPGTSWKCGYHSGLDLVSVAAGGDGAVYPIAEGTVLRTAYSAAYGNYVSVAHPDGFISLYAHLKQYLVREGQPISRDNVLGREGATGNATGPHLHLEVHKGEYIYPAVIDPEEFIRERIITPMSKYSKLPYIHAVTIAPQDFRVINWKRGKRTTDIKNYACFPFQASGITPVGNIISDGIRLASDSRLTTIWINMTGTVGVGKSPPTTARQAVSGIPLVIDGRRYSLAEAMAEGWDTSPLYATTHALLGIGGDGNLHYYVFNSTASGAAESFEEILNIAVQLGLETVLLGDGGGSTILDFGGVNKIVSGGNRQLATLIRF